MSRPYIELIAAVGPRWELGNQGALPWGRIKGDMALFRRVTDGKAVIMGRKTWESLPPAHRQLKGRLNIIMSRSREWGSDLDLSNVHVVSDGAGHCALEWALSAARVARAQPVIIGGAEVYRAALEADLVDVVHLSVIYNPEGWAHDVAFPALHAPGWVVADRHAHPAEDGAPHGWTQMRLVRDPAHPALGNGRVKDF